MLRRISFIEISNQEKISCSDDNEILLSDFGIAAVCAKLSLLTTQAVASVAAPEYRAQNQ